MKPYPKASQYIKDMCATIDHGVKKGVRKFKIMPTPYLEGDASAFLIATAIEAEFKRLGQEVRFEYGRDGIWFYITIDFATWDKAYKSVKELSDKDSELSIIVATALDFCHSRNIGFLYFDEFRRKVTQWIKTSSHDYITKEARMLTKYRYCGKVKQAEIRNVAKFCELLYGRGFDTLGKWDTIRKAIEKQLSEEYDLDMARIEARDRRIAEESRARKGLDT